MALHPPLTPDDAAMVTAAFAHIADVTFLALEDPPQRFAFRFNHLPYRPPWPEDGAIFLHPTACWVLFHGPGRMQDYETLLAALQRIFDTVGHTVSFVEAGEYL